MDDGLQLQKNALLGQIIEIEYVILYLLPADS